VNKRRTIEKKQEQPSTGLTRVDECPACWEGLSSRSPSSNKQRKKCVSQMARKEGVSLQESPCVGRRRNLASSGAVRPSPQHQSTSDMECKDLNPNMDPHLRRSVLEVQLVQLMFHKEQVRTCGQIEVQLSQQHGRLWKILQPQLATLWQCSQIPTN